MKYLILLVLLFVIAILGAYLNSQTETPTENQDNVRTIIELQVTTWRQTCLRSSSMQILRSMKQVFQELPLHRWERWCRLFYSEESPSSTSDFWFGFCSSADSWKTISISATQATIAIKPTAVPISKAIRRLDMQPAESALSLRNQVKPHNQDKADRNRG